MPYTKHMEFYHDLTSEHKVKFHKVWSTLMVEWKKLQYQFGCFSLMEVCDKYSFIRRMHPEWNHAKWNYVSLVNLKNTGAVTVYCEDEQYRSKIHVFSEPIVFQVAHEAPFDSIIDDSTLSLLHEMGHCLSFYHFGDIRETAPKKQKRMSFEEYYSQPIESLANELVGLDKQLLINHIIKHSDLVRKLAYPGLL